MAVKNRLHRSELAVPASNTRMLEKAPTRGADVVFLDLEDAVAVDEKEQARKNAIEALNDLDWSACSLSVRINGLDTPYCYRDIIEVVEAAGDKLDTILIPKVDTPSDILFVATLLSQIEAAKGFKPINIHILLESALGMTNVEKIAATCPERLEAICFGIGDYAASTHARITSMGGANPDYFVLTDPDEQGLRHRHWGNHWHYAMSRMIVACRAHGLRPIDGVYSNIADQEGFLALARAFATLGGEGKWAIHPSQVPLANQVFTPEEAEVENARRILRAMQDGVAEGKGAVTVDGRMVDAASFRQAQVLIEKVVRINAAGP